MRKCPDFIIIHTWQKVRFFFDYDGTLVDEREGIYTPIEKTIEAIRKLQDKGFLCLLATGRALNYVPQAVKDLRLDGFICSNGAYVTVHDTCIFQDVFDKRELCVLMREMDTAHINYFLESYAKCYVKDIAERHFQDLVHSFKLPSDAFVPLSESLNMEGIEKITIIPSDSAVTKRWMRKLQDRYDCCRNRHETSFDIGKKHMHKGIGVDKVLTHFDIPFAKTYAFGDGTNDIGLLKHVCHGIAMGIHTEELSDVAQIITTSVKEEGIYHALKEMEVIA